MPLSPLEIKKKEFTQKMRGADPDEVQAFLDQISVQVEVTMIEKKETDERMAILLEKLEHYISLEQTIEKTLAAAQQTAVVIQEQAKREAELILREAEIERVRKRNDARLEQERIERELLRLRAEYDITLARMRSLATSFQTFLDALARNAVPEQETATVFPDDVLAGIAEEPRLE